MDPTIREWCYAREVMRRLGFAAEDIFFQVHTKSVGAIIAGLRVVPMKGPVVSLVLRAQGKEFVWTIGDTELPADKIQAAYLDACRRWNDGNDPELNAGFQLSRAFGDRIALLEALRAKGISFGG